VRPSTPPPLSPSSTSRFFPTLEGQLRLGVEQIYITDLSGSLCQPPLDPSAGVCLLQRKVESSITPGSKFSPYLTGRATCGNLGRQERKHK
jgi:hypothetical protein